MYLILDRFANYSPVLRVLYKIDVKKANTWKSVAGNSQNKNKEEYRDKLDVYPTMLYRYKCTNAVFYV